MVKGSLSSCAEQVRRHDNDRFLCALFAPPAEREALFALYAFNLEVAKVREVVSEPALGLIRLQWWREVIDAIYAGRPAPRHEVAEPLAEAVRRHELSRAHFDRLLDAREFDMEDVESLVTYAEGTSATLAALALEVLDAREAAAGEAGRRVGIAWALTGLLRAVGFHARGGRLYLPRSLMRRHGLSANEVLAARPSAALAAVAAEVAATARRHLEEARARRPEVPRRALPALLPAVLADAYLGRMEKGGHDVLGDAAEVPRPARQIRLALSAWRGRY